MASDHKARQRVKSWFKKSAEECINPTEDNYIARDVLDIVSYVSELESFITHLLVHGRLNDIEIWKLYNKKD